MSDFGLGSKIISEELLTQVLRHHGLLEPISSNKINEMLELLKRLSEPQQEKQS